MRQGWQPDLVVFIGDLAFSGSAAEYALARNWLEEQLWPVLPKGLPRDRLLFVPGNHDVDRSKVGTGVRSMQEGLLGRSLRKTVVLVAAGVILATAIMNRFGDLLSLVGASEPSTAAI